jgi:NitT/TauT family transport system ATP-binding protein
LSKIIDLEHVWLQFSDAKTPTLKDISLSVEAGEIVVIVGPSGCGKSTLIEIVTGIAKATKGNIHVPDRVSMVFQTGALFPWLTVRDNVAIVLEAQKLPHKAIDL